MRGAHTATHPSSHTPSQHAHTLHRIHTATALTRSVRCLGCGCILVATVSAWLLLPVVWFPWFGKLLFSVCDCVLAALLSALLDCRRVPPSVSLSCVLVLLFNPLSLAVSTRGNGDVLHVCVLYAMLLCLMQHRAGWAAVCLGLAVHLRLYPLLYLPSLLLSLDSHYCRGGAQCQCGLDVSWLGVPLGLLTAATSIVCRPLPSLLPCAAVIRHRAMFAAVSALTFSVLFALCYAMYGQQFVSESVLHHIGRADTRHNFSLLFYPLYVTTQQQQSMAAVASLASFLPQLLLSALCSWCLSSDVSFCLLVQTALFVTFNKVVTAQYFLWYVSLLPLVLPFTRLSSAALFALSLVWLLAELHWLSWAYQVELLGLPAFAGLHAASCCFFLVCILCTAVLIAAHRAQPLFEHGRLTLYRERQQEEQSHDKR